MSEVAVPQRAVPFESASELREAHASLLEALDKQLAQDPSTENEAAALRRLAPRILEFLERGAATGSYLEEINERTACQVLLDYWASSLSQTGVPVLGARLARFNAERLPDLKDKPCPYVGLDAFREDTFFYGREADTQELLRQLRDAPLVIVLGASGSGKSSLVMGGVLPALASPGATPQLLIVPPFVPGNAVMDHAVEAVQRARGGAGVAVAEEVARLRQDPLHLGAMLGGPEAPPALVTIDQFEEVFTLSSPADREALVEGLANLLAAGRGHRVILTMREEFHARIVELRALGPYLDKAWYSMQPMGYEGLKAAVEGPAALVNLQFQPGIVDDLVKKVLGQSAALPLLQFTLRSLWEHRDRNRITREVYARVGDPLTALKTSADQFYEGLAPQTRDEVKRILLELVRVDKLLEAYRQPVPRKRLLQAGRANTEEVLGLLARNDYVRITSDAGDADAVVEVKHESLVRNWPRLVTWIDEKRLLRRQRLALTQAAERWATSGKPHEGLLTGWQLQVAEGQSDLSPLEHEFVLASIEAIDRAAREKEVTLRREAEEAKARAEVERQRAEEKTATLTRLRWFMIATYVLVVITVVAIVAAWWQMEEAQIAMRLQPTNYIDDQMDLALLLSVEASRMAPGQREVQRRLLSTLTANLDLQSFLRGHTNTVRAVAFSPDGKILASGSYDRRIFLWSVSTGRMLHPPLVGHEDSVFRLTFSPDGKTLASASLDKNVGLWDVGTGRPTRMLPQGAEVYSVAISRDGILASGLKDGTVRLWDLHRQQEESRPLVHAAREGGVSDVANVAFSPDGALLASGGLDGRIVLWDVRRRQPADERTVGQQVSNMAPHQVFSMAFSHDGKTIASGNEAGGVDLWDVQGRKHPGRFRASHLRGVYGVAFSPDDTELATVSADRTVYLRKVGSLQARPRRLTGYANQFYSVDFARGGQLATGTADGMVVLWDPRGPHRIGTILQEPTGKPTRLAFTRGGKTLVSSSDDKLLFWDIGRGQAASPVEVKAPAAITLIVAAPNGKNLATVGTDNHIDLWDVPARRYVEMLLKPRSERILNVAFSADSLTLAVSVMVEAGNCEIRLLNVPNGASRESLVLPSKDEVRALSFSPRGNVLASAGLNSGITIWDLAARKQSATLQRPNVLSLAFSPDGKILASSEKDGQLSLWDTGTYSPLGKLETNPSVGGPLESQTLPVQSLEFSPDGKLLTAASGDRTVLLWDVESRQKMSPPIEAHAAGVLSASFSPDGQSLASSAEDGSIYVWELSTPTWESRACQVAGRNFTPEEWERFFGDSSRTGVWERFLGHRKARLTCPGARVREADEHALTGDRAEAERLFKEALRGAMQTRDHDVNNLVCWIGSVDGFAKMVKPACEKAIALAPEVLKDIYRDSRGLARALTGDTAGATEDFTATVRAIKDLKFFDAEFRQRREQWIAALKEGRNPFNEALLKTLRTE